MPLPERNLIDDQSASTQRVLTRAPALAVSSTQYLGYVGAPISISSSVDSFLFYGGDDCSLTSDLQREEGCMATGRNASALLRVLLRNDRHVDRRYAATALEVLGPLRT